MGTIIGFYNGVRMSDFESKLRRADRKSPYRMDNDWASPGQVRDGDKKLPVVITRAKKVGIINMQKSLWPVSGQATSNYWGIRAPPSILHFKNWQTEVMEIFLCLADSEVNENQFIRTKSIKLKEMMTSPCPRNCP